MILRELRMNDREDALQAHREMAADGFDFLLDSMGSYDEDEPWSAYLSRLSSIQRGENVPSDWVPSTFLVAEVDGQLIGRVSIRHELNEFLERTSGHIGLGVRPTLRRQGYATQIFLRSLDVSRTLGLKRVLVTCDERNIASSKVIEKCGGVLEGIVEQADGEKLKRYWITL